MIFRRVRSLALLAVALLVASFSLRASAQAAKTSTEYPDSRVDVYGGYGWFHPLTSGVDHFQYMDITNPNATASVSYFFNHYVGVQMEGGYFSGNNEHKLYDPKCTLSNCDQLIYTAEAGPVLRYPLGPFVPFIHMLGGGERTNGPVDQHLMWGWGVTGGIGVDYILPFFNKRIAIRPIQADFQYSQVVYGPLVLPAGTTGGFGEIDALKLSGGVVLRLGEISHPEPLAFGCTLDPVSVYAGDPILVTGSTMNLNPKKPAKYDWQANGGKLTPHGQTANIDTTGLAPGEYTVAGHLSQGGKPNENASCTVPFTVRPILPPTLSCSASPATGVSGTTIDINATGTSPSNRPLTYSYAATAGTITANGQTAKLATAGLGASTIDVTCNVTDDLGQHATATSQVSISVPVVPVIAQTQTLCSISFERDTKRPVRVDNEAKACLDDIALTMSQQSDARLVMVGNAAPSEDPSAAAERTMNARQYLTQEKAVDASRIDVRVGATSGKSLDNVLVPTGATYLDTNTQSFDEAQIVRHGQAYGTGHGGAMMGVSTPNATPTHRKRRPGSKRRKTASGAHAASLTYVPDQQPVPNAAAAPTQGTPVTRIPPLQ